jgi:hypothetical protein
MWINREEYETLVGKYNKALDGMIQRDKTIEGYKAELAHLKGSVSAKEAAYEKELDGVRDNIRRFMEAAFNLHPTIFGSGPAAANWCYSTRLFTEMRMLDLTVQFEQEIKDQDDKTRITKFMEEILPKVLVPKNKMKITRARGRKNLIEKVEIIHGK